MVSNARLDLPEPESPVTTMRLSRGISTEMFLRLCTRAPCTAMVVRALARASVRLAVGGNGLSRSREGEAPSEPPGRRAPEGSRREARPPGIVQGDLEAIRLFLKVEEGQLLHFDVALPGELNRRGGLADQPLVGQILASCRDATDIEVPLEMVLDLGAGPCFADLAEMIDHRPEQCGCPLGQVAVDRLQRFLRRSSASSCR